MAGNHSPGQHFFDTTPEYGNFQSGDEMPTWDEVMHLLSGTHNNTITDEEWKKRRLLQFQARYLLPNYNQETGEIEVGTKKFKNLKIPDKAKGMIRDAYRETCQMIIDVIESEEEVTFTRKMSSSLLQPFYNAKKHTKEEFQRNKDMTHYEVHFTGMEQEVLGIICIFKACVNAASVRGKNEKITKDSDFFRRSRPKADVACS